MSTLTRRMAPEDTGLPADYAEAPWGRYRPGFVQRALIALARGTPLHHGRMRHRMTNLIRGLGSPLDVDFRGLRYRIEGRNNLMEYGLLLHPGYNREEIDFLCEDCPDGGVAVDIGANIGLYTLSLARAAGSGRAIAIDANPGVLERLAVNAASSGITNITSVNCAVGDHVGQVDLAIRRDDLSIVSVEESAGGVVPMRPLLDILAGEGVKRVDVLKIDIEGYEDAALVPFFAAAPEDMLPRRVVLERGGPNGGDYVGCAAAFDRLGYRLAGRTRSNSLYRRG